MKYEDIRFCPMCTVIQHCRAFHPTTSYLQGWRNLSGETGCRKAVCVSVLNSWKPWAIKHAICNTYHNSGLWPRWLSIASFPTFATLQYGHFCGRQVITFSFLLLGFQQSSFLMKTLAKPQRSQALPCTHTLIHHTTNPGRRISAG
jgi:hypothetical protein